jgi:predicted permease
MPREPFFRRYLRFWGADPHRDADEEVAFHLAMREDELRRAGMTDAEAKDAALQRFGQIAEVRAELHQIGERRVARTRRADRWDALRQDLRYAMRSIAANRMFAAMVVLTMAIGIGANTAVFSVASGVLLHPLPFRDANELVRLWSRNTPRGVEFFSVSPADYKDWAANNQVFSATAAFEREHDATLVRGSGEPQSVPATNVTPAVFSLLGTRVARGRLLTDDDARADAAHVALVSQELWRTRFGADTTLVGSQLTVDGNPVTVVGVMPPSFTIPGTAAQIWMPLSLAAAPTDHGNRYLRVLARLAPGIPIERARAYMDAVASRLAAAYPSSNQTWSVNIVPIPELIVGTQFRRALFALLGVVGFLLLIASANAANLQLARATARQREIALRAALGATRGRIVLQLVTESGLLALVASGIGLLLAFLGIVLLKQVGGSAVPRLAEVTIDAPVLAFTALVALGSGVLFGLFPALGASRQDAAEVLKTGGRGEGSGAARGIVRSALVVAQVSLSLVLLIGAGLLLRSVARLQSVDVGFDARNVAVVSVRLPAAWYPDAQRIAPFYAEFLDRVQHLPGVVSAAAVSSAPFAGPNAGLAFVPAEHVPAPDEHAPDADYRVITPEYLHTLGIGLVRGRDFTAGDRTDAPPVALVSETLVRRYLPDGNPIGRRLRVGDILKGPVFTIVGVVRDVRYQSLETPEVRPMMYFPALASPQRTMALVVRGVSVASLTQSVRTIAGSLDARMPPPPVATLESFVSNGIATRRFALVVFSVFAGVAAVLAALGIYGVMSYLVRQRAHETGIRIALGASSAALVGAIVMRTLRLAALGVAIGLAGAWALRRSLDSLLFGVQPTDPLTYAGIAALLIVVAGLASLAPALRSTRADPLEAMRGDA